MRKIIDISTYQDYIHWHKVCEQAGLDAAYFKATDGDWEDVKTGCSFSDNLWRWLKYYPDFAVLGGYGFYYLPRADQNGRTQASCLLRLLPEWVRPIGDYEPPTNVQWSPAYTEDARIYFDTLDQGRGYAVPIYTGEPFVNRLAIRNPDSTFSWPAWLTCRPLIFSAYPYRLPYGNRKLPVNEKFDQWNLNHRTYSAPIKPKNWREWPGKLWVWQFDDKGIVPGIQGNSVDLNYEWDAAAVTV